MITGRCFSLSSDLISFCLLYTSVHPDLPIFSDSRCLEFYTPDHPAVLYKYSAEMAEFLSDPEGQKTKDHVPDVHCDTGPVPESVLLPH